MLSYPPKHILVPMDLSGPSLAALETAKSVARKCGASLELVYVQDIGLEVPVFYPNGMIAAMPDTAKIKDKFRRWCAQRLREAAKDFPASRVRVRTTWGEPPERLVDFARGRSTGLVVMGTHGYAGWERVLHGSVAEAVVSRATVPVLTVRERARPARIAKILAPFNMTPYAEKALDYALELARGFHARVDVLYVAPEGSRRREVLAELWRRLGRAAGARRGKLGLRVAQGDPRHAIIAQAKRGGYDLIVLSAHRRPFSSDFVVGSTVERVLRHSPIPVLSVPSVGAAGWKEVQLYAGGMPTEKVSIPA